MLVLLAGCLTFVILSVQVADEKSQLDKTLERLSLNEKETNMKRTLIEEMNEIKAENKENEKNRKNGMKSQKKRENILLMQ